MKPSRSLVARLERLEADSVSLPIFNVISQEPGETAEAFDKRLAARKAAQDPRAVNFVIRDRVETPGQAARRRSALNTPPQVTMKRKDTTRAALEAASMSQADREARADLARRIGQQKADAAVRGYYKIREMQRRGLAPADFREAAQQVAADGRLQAAIAEISGFARRLTPEKIQAAVARDAQGGWDHLAEELLGEGLSQDALTVLHRLHQQRGGIQGVGQVLAEQIAYEDRGSQIADLQAQAAATLAQTVDSASAAAIDAHAEQFGEEATYQQLVSEGLHPAVAAVAVKSTRAAGGEGLAPALTARAQFEQTRARREAVLTEAQAAIERQVALASPKPDDPAWGQKLKERTGLAALLRDPEFHRSVLPFYADRVDELRAAGLGPKAGEAPGSYLIRLAQELGPDGTAKEWEALPHAMAERPTRERSIAKLSTALQRSPAEVEAWLGQAHALLDQGTMAMRLAKSSDAEKDRRRKGPDAPPTRAAQKAALDRARIEAADELHPTPEAKAPASSTLRAAIEMAAGEEPVLDADGRKSVNRFLARRKEEEARDARTPRARVEQAAAYLESRSSQASPSRTESSTPSSSSTTTPPSERKSVREALEHAASTLGDTTDDDE